MKKNLLMAIMITLLFMISITAGIYSYYQQNAKESNPQGSIQLAQEKSDSIGTIRPTNTSVETASQDVKISPNAVIIEKQYYQGCDHFTEAKRMVPQNLINQGEDKVKQTYFGWNIEKLTNNEITVYRENIGYCPQHYIIKTHDGVLGIYTLDQTGKIIWKEDTDIQTMYLPDEDLERVNMGIQVIGDEQLHSVLEDFE